MDPQRWKQVKAILDDALSIEPEARSELLDRRCGSDTDLRQEVESLLRSHADPFATTRTFTAADGGADRIGPYTLRQKLGAGGMGDVFLADQTHPVRRQVALKLIRLGMDTREVVARFEAERQALAVMDHPNIASVFDGGATAEGRPYFVMELVRGVPITAFCDERKLSVEDRLKLFIVVCQAVQHAHQKGVIHRDLKPSNILVGFDQDRAIPKIIDFGVAKATGPQLTDKTLHTTLGQMIGTPEYMSPEQAGVSGLDIDTRSDIYALGVILYEMLVGTLPFDSKELRAKSFEEMQRVIREQDPPKPSTRITSTKETLPETAQRRQTDPQTLTRQLRGDLDWIVMKALEKDRARRYETANAFALDLQRYLDSEPVSARPPSVTYRAGKFIRRNKLGVAMASALTLALLVGVAGTTVGLLHARSESSKSRAVTEFLKNMLKEVDPEKTRGQEVTVKMALDEVSSTVEESFGAEPKVEAEIQLTLGSMYNQLGDFTKALPHIERAVVLATQHFGAQSELTLQARNQLAMNHYRRRQHQEAAVIWEQLLDDHKRLNGDEHERTLTVMHNLGTAYSDQEKYTEAEELLSVALAGRRKLHGIESLETTATMSNLAEIYKDTNRSAQAEPLFHELMDIRRRILGPDHPRTLITTYNFGAMYEVQERFQEAEPLIRASLEGFDKVYGQDHGYTLMATGSMAIVLLGLDRASEAEPHAVHVLTQYKERLGPSHEYTREAAGVLSKIYEALGRTQDAKRPGR